MSDELSAREEPMQRQQKAPEHDNEEVVDETLSADVAMARIMETRIGHLAHHRWFGTSLRHNYPDDSFDQHEQGVREQIQKKVEQHYEKLEKSNAWRKLLEVPKHDPAYDQGVRHWVEPEQLGQKDKLFLATEHYFEKKLGVPEGGRSLKQRIDQQGPSLRESIQKNLPKALPAVMVAVGIGSANPVMVATAAASMAGYGPGQLADRLYSQYRATPKGRKAAEVDGRGAGVAQKLMKGIGLIGVSALAVAGVSVGISEVGEMAAGTSVADAPGADSFSMGGSTADAGGAVPGAELDEALASAEAALSEATPSADADAPDAAGAGEEAPAAGEGSAEEPAVADAPVEVTLEEGDTLSEVMHAQMQAHGVESSSYQDIADRLAVVAEANGIEDLDQVQAGESVTIPPEALAQEAPGAAPDVDAPAVAADTGGEPAKPTAEQVKQEIESGMAGVSDGEAAGWTDRFIDKVKEVAASAEPKDPKDLGYGGPTR